VAGKFAKLLHEKSVTLCLLNSLSSRMKDSFEAERRLESLLGCTSKNSQTANGKYL
jgi:hypothetical protein